MPRVAEVGAVVINVYFNDHNPPHFHAISPDAEGLIAIRDFAVIRGTATAAVLDWARANQAALIDAWNRCNPANPY